MVYKYTIVFTNCVERKRTFWGPMLLSALVRAVEVSKYKVSKHCYIYLLPRPPSLDDVFVAINSTMSVFAAPYPSTVPPTVLLLARRQSGS